MGKNNKAAKAAKAVRNEVKNEVKEEVLVVDKDITKQEEKKPEEKPAEETPKNPSPSKKGTKVLTPMYIPTSKDVVAEPVGTEAILAQVMMQKYYNNPELKKQCPELYSEMSRSIDFVVFIALVKSGQDFIKSGSKLGLKLTVPVEQVLPLQGMATMLGVELLPNCMQLSNSDSSQMEIDFTKVKAPEEFTEEGTIIEEEKAPEVELDPTKIETKDQLKDALAIMLNGPETNKSVIGAILTTLKWYDSYLFNDFHSAEEKLAADKLTIADKMNKILEVVKPNGLFNGIGSAAYQKAKQTKTLVGSFCVIKKHVMIQNGELTDREIASLLKCFIEHVAIKLNCDRDPKDKIKIEDDPVVKLLSSNGVDDIETILKKDYEHRNAIEGIIRSTLHQPGKTISRNEIITDIVNVYNLFRNETDQLDSSVFYEAPAPAPAPTETSKEEVKNDESKEQPKEEKEIDTSKDGKKDSNKNKSQKKNGEK